MNSQTERPQQITDEMVERAARAVGETVGWVLVWDDVPEEDRERFRRGARASLEAALGDPAAAPSPPCYRCGGSFTDGQEVYVQTDRRIEARGQTVTFHDVEVLVCAPCAETEEVSS